MIKKLLNFFLFWRNKPQSSNRTDVKLLSLSDVRQELGTLWQLDLNELIKLENEEPNESYSNSGTRKILVEKRGDYPGPKKPKEFGNINIQNSYSDIKYSTKIIPEETEWLIGMSNDFVRSIQKVDMKLKGRILVAISKISKEPEKPIGNTVKPLTSELKGKWRYRMGDYRLIYQPNAQKKTVILMSFSPRGSSYA